MLAIRDLEAGERKKKNGDGEANRALQNSLFASFPLRHQQQKSRSEEKAKGKKRDGASSLSLKFRHLSRFLDWS